jgi:beta-lactamase regulating signal transducer with metallopeptidase domain
MAPVTQLSAAADPPSPSQVISQRAAAAPVQASPPPARLNRGELFLSAFLAGAMMSLSWLILGAVQASRLRRGGSAMTANDEDRIRRFLSDQDLPIRVRLSDRITYPVALGVFSPTILLPERFVRDEPSNQLRAAILHEEAHIRNGDLVFLAVCRLALLLFYPQPLFWILKRQALLDQEALADTAAAQGEQARYAEMLLGWAAAGLGPSRDYAPALGLWERSSQLRQRITLLLDSHRTVEPRAPSFWRFGSWTVAGVTVLGLSLTSFQPGSRGLIAGARLADEGRDPADVGAVPFRGQVLGPDGQPFAGARITLDYFSWRDYLKSVPPPLRATTGSDGRFQFTVDKEYFARPPLEEPWRYANVVAMAEGLGLGFSDSEESDYDRELTIRLAPDDAPIAGRLLDLEGRPVSGATVRVTAVHAPPGGDLSPFLAAAKNVRTRLIELKNQRLNKELRCLPYYEPIPAATSGPDGKFVIRGVGRERLVDLEIKGSTTRWVRISAFTRPGPPTDLVEHYSPKNPWIERYHGSPFELALSPSRPYEGIIRDLDSGLPIAGATLQGAAFADKDFLNYTAIETKSDGEGRFSLPGMPFGKGNEVVVLAPEDQPYLPAKFRLPEFGASNLARLDLALKRGVWLKGRVRDRTSGKPLEARVRYHAAVSNSHLNESPGFGDLQFGNNQDLGSQYTSEAGTYRIAVLPGPGLLTMHVVNGGHYARDEAQAAKPNEAAFRPIAYGLGDAWSTIVVGDKEASHDFSVVPAPTRTVHGLIFDPAGNPVTGARFHGMFDIQYWYPIERNNQFAVTDLRPREPRTLSRLISIRDRDELGSYFFPEDTRPVAIIQQQGRLAGYTEVGWNTPEPVRVTLRPWAELTARVVDSDGQPRGDFGVEPKIVLRNRTRNHWIDHWTERIFTDLAGRVRIEGLIPGLNYRLVFEDENGSQSNQGLELEPLKPGEVRQLGDIKIQMTASTR